jgi:hypothetical protein
VFAVFNSVAIDRRMQESDVMERVLGIDDEPDTDNVRTEVISLAIQPWLAGIAVSAVQLSVGVRPKRPHPKTRR